MKIVCLNCITSFDSSQVVYKNRDGTDYVQEAAPKRGFLNALRKAIDGDDIDDDRAAQLEILARGLKPHCPVNGCEIPREMVERPTKVIGFVGEPGSSKTSVITSMFHRAEVNNDLTKVVDFSLTASSFAQWKKDRDMQFGEHVPVKSTTLREGVELSESSSSGSHQWKGLAAREPLVVEVSNVRGSEKVNLIFIDLAGEDALTAENAAQVSPHLAIADHLWFFLTPNLNDDVVRELSKSAPADVVKNLYDSSEHNQDQSRTKIMIREISKLWKRVNGLHPDSKPGRPRIHVTAILAKADLLSSLRSSADVEQLVSLVAPPADWLTNTSAQSDLMDAAALDMRSTHTSRLVEHLYPQIHLSIVGNFPEAVFLPVAATGNVTRTRKSGSLVKDASERFYEESERFYEDVKPFGVVDLFYSTVLATDELRLT